MDHDGGEGRRGGTLRNVVVTFASVAVVMGLAVFVPSMVPAMLRPALTAPLAEAPIAAPGSAGDSPQRRLPDDAGSYRFSATQPGSPRQPVTYRSCEPIRVTVNLAGAPDPASDLRMVLDAMERIEETTGLTMEYVGNSDERPRWEEGTVSLERSDLEDPEPVLVSYADAEEVPQLAGGVAGIAGSVVVQEDGRSRYLTGQVTLDSDSFTDLHDSRGGDDVAAAITLHELAHLIGLDHVDDPRELMFPTTTEQRDFGAGDLEGLRRLGQGRDDCG